MKILAGATALALALAAGAAGAATVQNGSFEDHPHVSNWAVFGSIPGWTTLSGAGIEIQTNATLGTIDAHSGTSYVELDSHNNSSMAQVISFGATGLYELSFWYSPRRALPGSNTIEYFMGGTLLGSVTGPDATTAVGSWTEITARFVIDTIGDYTLAFAATGTDDSYGGLIDDVSISAVPLPAGGLLLMTALGGLGLARRRRG